MGCFSYMKVHCPICKSECDGMKTVGRESHCCDRECHREWEWRRALAIMGEQWYPQPGSRWDDSVPVEEFVAKRMKDVLDDK